MSLDYSAVRFDPSWYRPWCLTWLHAQRHSAHLAELAQNLPSSQHETTLAEARSRLGSALDACLSALDTGHADDGLLLRAHACLRALDARYREESRQHSQSPPIVETGQGRWLLVPPPKLSTRPNIPDRIFPLADELGVAGALGLRCRWLSLQAEDELEWSRIPDLDPLRGLSAMHVGAAPLAELDDMQWDLAAAQPLGPDRRVPLRCTGARDGSAVWARIEPILAAAYAAGVHILLMPELAVDVQTLERCRGWLAANNLREPRLRLVVAGSRHCDCRDGFANRCTVLDYAGDVLWEQEKRSPFVLEDRATLERLSPDRVIERAFEPTALAKRLVVAETGLGRVLTPICLDFIEGDFWADLGADLYLVPAMTGGLSRFRRRAEDLGGRHGAATLVCNARMDKERHYAYRPARSPIVLVAEAGVELFTAEIELSV